MIVRTEWRTRERRFSTLKALETLIGVPYKHEKRGRNRGRRCNTSDFTFELERDEAVRVSELIRTRFEDSNPRRPKTEVLSL